MKLSLFAVLLMFAVWTPATAQTPEPAGSSPAADAQGWNFDEEDEEAPSWAADIRAQATAQYRQAVVQIDDRAGGTRPIVQSPYRFSAAESGVRRPAPWKGEHNDEVLKEWLGLDAAGRRKWAGVLVRSAPSEART